MTSVEIWAPFVLFAVVASATPGPNNLLLLTSGLRVGLWRSLPFIVGISVGFSVLLVATGYGLGQVFERHPPLHEALKVAGTGYFVYLAWVLLRPTSALKRQDERQLGFWTGVTFQAINPKAWLMAITAVALFLPPSWGFPTVALMAALFVMVGFPANVAWAGAGQMLQSIVHNQTRMRVFNGTMALLLVLSILPVWMPIQ